MLFAAAAAVQAQTGSRPDFMEKLTGALYGGAIGDGMGAPVEGDPGDSVRARFLNWDFRRFIPAQSPGAAKGGGRITDDTLMSEALMRAYNKARDHMDAYGYRDYMVPEMVKTLVWLPERQREMAIIGRMNPIEHYSVFRLTEFAAWPFAAGTGGALNDGVAMWIMPVGAVNAGDPIAAWREAVSLGSAEAESHSVEAAAALAAAYAAAFEADASVESVLRAVEDVLEFGPGRAPAKGAYHDDTLFALRAALSRVNPRDSEEQLANVLLTAVLPFTRDAIEEIPIALAVFRYGGGDFLKTLRAAVLYGRDADSIAGMACGLAGALRGADAIPAELRTASNEANRRDFAEIARTFHHTAMEILDKDRARWNRRLAATK